MPRPTIPVATAGREVLPTSTNIDPMAAIITTSIKGRATMDRIGVPSIVTTLRGPITGGIMPDRCVWAFPRTM